jgi:hypothetical protein
MVVHRFKEKRMELVLTFKTDKMTVTVECPTITDFKQINEIFDNLTSKAINEVKPTVKRGRGHPRKHPKGV